LIFLNGVKLPTNKISANLFEKVRNLVFGWVPGPLAIPGPAFA